MFRNNNNKPSIFSRIKKSVSKAFKKVTGFLKTEDTETVKGEKKPSIIKKAINRIRQATTKTASGTTRRIPTAKYSTGEKGWGKTDARMTNKHGKKVSHAEYEKLDKWVQEYNKELEKKTQNIIENAYKVFPQEQAENMEHSIRMAIERDSRRFSHNLFEDLRELNTKELFERVKDNENIEDFINDMMSKDFYSLEDRNESYKENYKKALFNEWGDTTKTREIASIIDELDTDTFMLSYYNEYAGVSILAIYEEAYLQSQGFLNKLEQFYTNLKERQHELDWN